MKPIKIAVVESNKATRMMLTGMLPTLSQGSVSIPIEAATGAELLYKLSGELPDIILLDMFTPVMEGIETTGYLRALFPEITIVALASHADDFDPALIEILGIQSVLLRNQPLEFMVSAIKAIYSGKVVMPELRQSSKQVQKLADPILNSAHLFSHHANSRI